MDNNVKEIMEDICNFEYPSVKTVYKKKEVHNNLKNANKPKFPRIKICYIDPKTGVTKVFWDNGKVTKVKTPKGKVFDPIYGICKSYAIYALGNNDEASRFLLNILNKTKIMK